MESTVLAHRVMATSAARPQSRDPHRPVASQPEGPAPRYSRRRQYHRLWDPQAVQAPGGLTLVDAEAQRERRPSSRSRSHSTLFLAANPARHLPVCLSTPARKSAGYEPRQLRSSRQSRQLRPPRSSGHTVRPQSSTASRRGLADNRFTSRSARGSMFETLSSLLRLKPIDLSRISPARKETSTSAAATRRHPPAAASVSQSVQPHGGLHSAEFKNQIGPPTPTAKRRAFVHQATS